MLTAADVVRQWVLSVPKRLRYFMQRDGAVLNMVLRIFLRVIAQSLQTHNLPAEILARHDAAQAQFEQRAAQFNQISTQSSSADDKVNALDTFFKQYPAIRSISPLDKAKPLPWSTPKPNTRAPAETKTAWYQNLYADKKIQLAQVGPLTSFGGIQFNIPPVAFKFAQSLLGSFAACFILHSTRSRPIVPHQARQNCRAFCTRWRYGHHWKNGRAKLHESLRSELLRGEQSGRRQLDWHRIRGEVCCRWLHAVFCAEHAGAQPHSLQNGQLRSHQRLFTHLDGGHHPQYLGGQLRCQSQQSKRFH